MLNEMEELTKDLIQEEELKKTKIEKKRRRKNSDTPVQIRTKIENQEIRKSGRLTGARPKYNYDVIDKLYLETPRTIKLDKFSFEVSKDSHLNQK